MEGKTATDGTRQMFLEDKLRRDTFKMAYFTEIGAVNRLIDKDEFHDLVVCSGIDVTSSAIDEAWPKDKNEINIEEAYHLFTRLPNLEFRIKHAFESLERDTGEKEPLPFDAILEKCKKSLYFSTPEKLAKLTNFIEGWRIEKVTAGVALHKFNETKRALNNINQTLCERAKRGMLNKDFNQDYVLNGALQPLEINYSDAESSVFLDEPGLEDGKNERAKQMFSYDARSLSERRVSTIEDGSRKGSLAIADKQSYALMKTTRKSLVIHSKIRPTALKHIFTLTKMQNVKIQVSVNIRLDPDLSRFENAIYGVLQLVETEKIIAVTTRKSKNLISTERLTLEPATYSFKVAFCRGLPNMKTSTTEEIVDSKKKLTTKYRMCIINIFDMFDLNEDQTLDFTEFCLYNQMSGGGNITGEDWDSLLEQLTTKNGGLSIKSFVALHQEEVDTYEDKNFDNVYYSLKQLGFNGKFAITNACPVIVDYLSSDEKVNVTTDEPYYFDDIFDELLAKFFWSRSSALPYLKSLPLQMWTCDYFAVLLAGATNTANCYRLNLNGSQNVNLDIGKDMIIEETVPAYVCKILFAGFVVDAKHKWFISIHRVQSDHGSSSNAAQSPAK